MKNCIEIPVDIYKVSVIIFFGSTIEEIIKYGITHNVEKEKFTKEWKLDFFAFLE